MSNVIQLPVDREPGSVAEWRQALAAAEQRCSDSRTRANAQEQRARGLNARVALLEAERDAAVKEARCADIQRRIVVRKLEAMQRSVPLAATGLGILLGAMAMAVGMWVVMA